MRVANAVSFAGDITIAMAVTGGSTTSVLTLNRLPINDAVTGSATVIDIQPPPQTSTGSD